MNKGADMAVSTPLKENTNLKAALGYARFLGWSVFPLHSIINGKCTCNKDNCSDAGKHPATKNGLKDATKEEQKIIKWWTDRPFLNIGVATGQVSGFFAVDIDNKLHKGTGMTGFEALEELENKYSKLPDTVQQYTGSGGLHILFRYEEGIRNKGNIFPSIDIRGDGGYIVVSPSVHETGNKYEWDAEYHPLEHDIKVAPSWLNNILNQKNQPNGKYKPKPTSEYLRIFQGVCEGERNNALVTLIGHLIVRLDYREAFEIVHLWNETRVNPPLEADTVTTAFNNILRREAEKR